MDRKTPLKTMREAYILPLGIAVPMITEIIRQKEYRKIIVKSPEYNQWCSQNEDEINKLIHTEQKTEQKLPLPPLTECPLNGCAAFQLEEKLHKDTHEILDKANNRIKLYENALDLILKDSTDQTIINLISGILSSRFFNQK